MPTAPRAPCKAHYPVRALALLGPESLGMVIPAPPQVLDSNRSGGLSSSEFCQALKKLVNHLSLSLSLSLSLVNHQS